MMMEDEDQEFKSTINNHITFQRSYYPQQTDPFQRSYDPQQVYPVIPFTSTFSITNEISLKQKKSQRNASQEGIFMKLEGRYRYSNVAKLPQLRILKRDIRRLYMEMYYNVSNSHDIQLYSRFLHDFCTPNCSEVVHIPSLPQPVVQNGISEMILDSFIDNEKIPDGVLRWSGDAKISVRLQTPGSRIIAPVSYQGTHLFEALKEHDPSSSSSLKKEIPFSGEGENFSQDRVHSPLPSAQSIRLSPTPVPFVIDVNAILTMHLDESNHIEKFVFNSLSFSVRKAPS